eukprot:GHVU01026714.1.p1 GENE.GHVU01026714.1~~GHVU01026714.1.p1  ORF type:complete len:144 (+),score=6.83 GHVU01026714.1:527-958(+)
MGQSNDHFSPCRCRRSPPLPLPACTIDSSSSIIIGSTRRPVERQPPSVTTPLPAVQFRLQSIILLPTASSSLSLCSKILPSLIAATVVVRRRGVASSSRNTSLLASVTHSSKVILHGFGILNSSHSSGLMYTRTYVLNVRTYR